MKTVGDLRKFIEGLDDKIPLIKPGPDHDYTLCGTVDLVDAVYSRTYRTLNEYYEEIELEPTDRVLPALLVV